MNRINAPSFTHGKPCYRQQATKIKRDEPTSHQQKPKRDSKAVPRALRLYDTFLTELGWQTRKEQIAEELQRHAAEQDLRDAYHHETKRRVCAQTTCHPSVSDPSTGRSW